MKKEELGIIYQFYWVHTVVNIPVFSSLDTYLDIPYVELIVNQEKDTHPIIYKKNNIEYTTQSTICTSILGDYALYYKAICSYYSISSIQKIIFHVYDDTPPILKNEGDIFEIEINNLDFNFLSELDYYDNYDSKEDVKIQLELQYIDYNQIGTYPFRITLYDQSQNNAYFYCYAKIIDTIPPWIIQTKDFVVNVGTTNLNSCLFDFFEVEDNDSFHIPTFYIEDFSIQGIGEYNVTLHALDYSKNESIYKTILTIQDLEPPTIVLESSYYSVNNFNQLTEEYLKSLMIEAYDNYDDTSKLSLTITKEEIQRDELLVSYILEDSSHNKTEKFILFSSSEFKAPTIYGEDTMIEIKEIPYFSILDGMEAYDYRGENITCYITTDFDRSTMNQIGIYKVLYEVYDEENHYQNYIRTIEVFSISPKRLDYWIGLGILLTVFFLIGGILYLKKRKNKENTF